MPDVTGRVYEAFTEFILRRLGYRDEWTAGEEHQFLYEGHREALCHQREGICPHYKKCDAFSKSNNVPYGPWYDPDFFILDNETPIACIHVTHWSNPRDSKRKFWRSIEDHLQYKTSFGPNFRSINLVFDALNIGNPPRLFSEIPERVSLHGWDPAIGSVLVSSFDASIAFPREYALLEKFAAHLPEGHHGSSRRRRALYNNIWISLYTEDDGVRKEVDQVTSLLGEAMRVPSVQRFSTSAIRHLQDVCFSGRLKCAGLAMTDSRYRKGLQQAFILREVIARFWKDRVDPDDALWGVLTHNPRFPLKHFRAMLQLPEDTTEVLVRAFGDLLASIPVRIDNNMPMPLFIESAGLEHSSWDPDFAQFILGLRHLNEDSLRTFRQAVNDLFSSYRLSSGMDYVLADLADPERVRRKVQYVYDNYLSIADHDQFILQMSTDMLTPGSSPPHQYIVPDVHNWVLDVILSFYDLGSVQEINNRIFRLFEEQYGESLRLYAYQGNYLVGYLLSGVDVAPYIQRSANFSRDHFYQAIWPLISECVWEAIQGRTAIALESVMQDYRYKKAMRIISSPDLEPISFLFRRSLPRLTDGPTLRGAYNQLSTQRGWSRSALTTETSGQDSKSGAMIQTQSVFGGKHISDKTREIAARLRSVHLRCNVEGVFEPESNPGTHYLVVDGDWPITSKINLYEAGFQGIFEIAELDKLADELTRRSETD